MQKLLAIISIATAAGLGLLAAAARQQGILQPRQERQIVAHGASRGDAPATTRSAPAGAAERDGNVTRSAAPGGAPNLVMSGEPMAGAMGYDLMPLPGLKPTIPLGRGRIGDDIATAFAGAPAAVPSLATLLAGQAVPNSGRNGVPQWEVDPDFANDVFTFVRIRYGSHSGWRRWATDYPDSDLNFSYRLSQLTSLKVDPNGKVLELSDPALFDYPFVYLIEPGTLEFTEAEVEALRRYLLSGGFLMVDDFWGEAEWDNFAHEMRRVFPDRDPVELDIDHPIFHCVYDLKSKPQVPSIGVAQWGRSEGVTWEREDAKTPHYKALYDDRGRMISIICHNTDLGDGWEREGEDPWYFHEFSEKHAYPLGINVVFYAMSH